MDLDQLRAFVATLEHGSLSAAARQLRRTQPGLTRLIQSLEAEVGSPLLDRSTKPARPTARGIALAESARKVLEAMGELEAAARPRRRKQPVLFRLGISHAMVRLLEDASFSIWLRSNPKLELRVESGWSLGLVSQLRERTLDAVLGPFSTSWEPPAGLQGHRLGEDALVLAAPSGLKVPESPRLQDLVSLPWVLNPDGCGIRAFLQRTFAEDGRELCPAVEVTGDFGVLLDFVAAGFGITLAPRWMAQAHPQGSGMQILSLQDARLRSAFWLCFRPAGGSIQPVLDALITTLQKGMDARLALHSSRKNGI